MKQSEIYTEKDFGKRSDTSSHYRINCGGTKVLLMSTVKEENMRRKSEFLMCQIGFKHEFVVAVLHDYKHVKLYTLKNYIESEYEGRNMPFVEIAFTEYINPKRFTHVLERNFLNIHPKQKAV